MRQRVMVAGRTALFVDGGPASAARPQPPSRPLVRRLAIGVYCLSLVPTVDKILDLGRHGLGRVECQLFRRNVQAFGEECDLCLEACDAIVLGGGWN